MLSSKAKLLLLIFWSYISLKNETFFGRTNTKYRALLDAKNNTYTCQNDTVNLKWRFSSPLRLIPLFFSSVWRPFQGKKLFFHGITSRPAPQFLKCREVPSCAAQPSSLPDAPCYAARMMYPDELVAGGGYVKVRLFLVNEECVRYPDVFDELRADGQCFHTRPLDEC